MTRDTVHLTIPQGRELLALLFAFSLVLGAGLVSYTNWIWLDRANREREITDRIVRTTTALLSALRDAETGQRGFLLTGRDEDLEPYLLASARVPRHLSDLTAAGQGSPDQARRIDAIRPLVANKLAELQQTIDFRRIKGIEAALAVVMNGEGKATMDRIRKICSELETNADSLSASRSEELARRVTRSGLFSILGTVALFAMLIAATAAFQRGTQRRQELIQGLREREEEAKQSSDWFQTTLSSIGDAVIATDTGARITFLNAVAQSLTGWTQEEAVGLPLEQVFVITNEETGAAVENPVNKALREGKVVGLANHTTLTARDGGRVPIDDSAAIIRDAGGSVAGVVLVFRDISERKAAEAELTRAEQRFRTAVSAVTDILWTNSPQGQMEGEQPKWAAFTGQSREEYQGFGWASAVHPDDAQPTIDEWNRAVAGKRRFSFEHRVRRHDGVWRIFSISALPVLDAAGTIQEWVGVHTDITEEKEAADALRASEARYHRLSDYSQAVINNMAEGLYTVDKEGLLTFMNPAAERMFGWTNGELAGKKMHDATHYKHRDGSPFPTLECASLQVLQKGVALQNHEDCFIRKDGSFLPVVFSASPLVTNGETIGIVVAFRDVTAQLESQAALRRSEERLRIFVEASSQVIYRMNADWTQMLELHARDRMVETETLPSRLLETQVHPDDRGRLMAAIEEAIRAKSVFELEHRVKRADGTWGWTFSRAIPVLDRQDGSIAEWFGAASDVTGRKLSEEKLLESEERFRTLANNMSQLAWMTDQEGWIFWYNQRWYDYTGTTLEEMQGWGWRKVHHPDHVDRVVKHIWNCFLTGEIWEDTFPLRGKDGNYRWFLSRALPIRNTAGEIVRWFGTNTDVTELREAQEQLRRANEDLTQFAFAASHDLKEPLRMITSYSQLLVSGYRGKLDGEAELCVGFIVDGTRRMRELLDDLLTYTSVTNVNEKAGALDLDQVFQEVNQSLKAAIEESGAVITSDPLPIVSGNRAHFVQLFQNLIGNAIKYRAERPLRIRVSAQRSDGQWRFSVADNGIGIAPQHHEKIFGVFKRLHGKHIPGTGIGLAICQRVVERYHGRIWVESAADRGATFYFTLPVANEAAKTITA